MHEAIANASKLRLRGRRDISLCRGASFDGAILLAQDLGRDAADALLGAARTAFSSAFELTIVTAAALLFAAAVAVAITTLKTRNGDGSRTD